MPRRTGISRELAIKNAAVMTGCDTASVVDVIVITSHECPGCGRPHIVRLSSTSDKPETIVAVCSMAILDIIDVYDVSDNPEQFMNQYGDGGCNGVELEV